jgi:hypothetical protein
MEGRCAVRKRLTITLDEEVYHGLHRAIGPGKISRFVEDLVRSQLNRFALEAGYNRMAQDLEREKEAMIWAGG